MRLSAIIISLLMIFSISKGFAQEEDYGKKDKSPRVQRETFDYNSENDGKKWDWTNARIGGNFAMSFSNGGLFIDASPTFGYRINRIVEAGLGYKMLYFRQRDVFLDNNTNQTFDYKSVTHGPLAYGRFTVWDGIFVMAQYEMANKEPYFISSFADINNRINVHHLLLGGGYSQPIGNAGSLNISLLYDVIDSKESIYQFGTFGERPLLLNISVGFGISKRRP